MDAAGACSPQKLIDPLLWGPEAGKKSGRHQSLVPLVFSRRLTVTGHGNLKDHEKMETLAVSMTHVADDVIGFGRNLNASSSVCN